jgi:acetyl esterase/lipase
VVGDSAGGNIAAAVTLKTAARPQDLFPAVVLFLLHANFETGSYTQFQDGP